MPTRDLAWRQWFGADQGGRISSPVPGVYVPKANESQQSGTGDYDGGRLDRLLLHLSWATVRKSI